MTEEVARPSCLLVMPRDFHVISRVFVETLEGRGFEVTQANEDYPENALGKVLSKLDLPIARWWTRKVVNARFLAGRRWSLILIVKGRGVGPQLVADMKRCCERVVGYHFDALAYDRATARWSGAVDRVSTFDYRDAEERGWPLVELFATRGGQSPPPQVRYRVSAIMRNHSDRLAFIDRTFAILGRERSFVYVFEKGLLGLLINFLRNPLLYWRWRRHIHFKPLDYGTYCEVMATSDFTLDYAHPLQTGATLRSFEALATGVKLITNNAWPSRRSAHFGPHNSVVCDGVADPAELRRQVESLVGARPAPYQRTPEAFMAEVLDASPEGGQGIDLDVAAGNRGAPPKSPRNIR